MHAAATSRPTRAPSSRPSRSSRSSRSKRSFLALVVAAIAITGVSACGDVTPQPTLSTVNFSPKLVVTVADGHLVLSKGPRDDAAVSLGGPIEATVPAGTVIEVVNDGPSSHRLQGDTVFDTGILRKGERTTIVLTNDGTADKRLAITDPGDGAVQGAIIVRPKPTA
jgi:hypothetical protein